MKYCTGCSSEYQDQVTVCADCGGGELVSAEEMRRRGLPLPHEIDTRRFVRAGIAEDPLTSEQFTAVLEAAGIASFARPRRAGTVDVVTSGSASPWWEILVPEEAQARATQLLQEERARFDATAEEAARAAEEEEAEQEAGAKSS